MLKSSLDSWERRGGMVKDTATGLLIEATGVQKVYASGGLRVHALENVDLGIRRGEWSPS